MLRSKTAVEVSIRIMDSFVEMRHLQVRGVELRLLEYQKTTDERFERIFDYVKTYETPRRCRASSRG